MQLHLWHQLGHVAPMAFCRPLYGCESNRWQTPLAHWPTEMPTKRWVKRFQSQKWMCSLKLHHQIFTIVWHFLLGLYAYIQIYTYLNAFGVFTPKTNMGPNGPHEEIPCTREILVFMTCRISGTLPNLKPKSSKMYEIVKAYSQALTYQIMK